MVINFKKITEINTDKRLSDLDNTELELSKLQHVENIPYQVEIEIADIEGQDKVAILDEFFKLFNEIYIKKYPCKIVITNNNLPGNLKEDLNSIFYNLYLKNYHYYQAQSPLIQNKLTQANFSVLDTTNIRKLKLPQKKKKSKVQTQTQQEQEQQEEEQQEQTTKQQTSTTNAVLSNRNVQEDAIEAEPRPLPINRNNYIWINKDNIVSELGEEFPHLDLYEIWDNLVGATASRVASEHTISFVEKETMIRILEQHELFKDGLAYHNLPTNFEFKSVTENGLTIKVLQKLPGNLNQDENVNPLRISLEKTRSVSPQLEYCYQQILPENISTESLNKIFSQWGEVRGDKAAKKFNQIKNKLKNEKESKKAFEEILSIFCQGKNDTLIEIKKYLATHADFNQHHYSHLFTILSELGPESLRIFLHHLSLLKQNKLFDDFKNNFLDRPCDYVSLANADGIAQFETLLSLPDNEIAWWNSLTTQHAEANSAVDFIKQFKAFTFFTDSLKKHGEISVNCGMSHVKNMLVAMDRALYIIDHASNKREQLDNLAGLDFGAEGAYFASYFEKFGLITREMRITPRAVSDNKFYFPVKMQIGYQGMEVQFADFPDNQKPLHGCKEVFASPLLPKKHRAIYNHFRDEYERNGYPQYKDLIIYEFEIPQNVLKSKKGLLILTTQDAESYASGNKIKYQCYSAEAPFTLFNSVTRYFPSLDDYSPPFYEGGGAKLSYTLSSFRKSSRAITQASILQQILTDNIDSRQMKERFFLQYIGATDLVYSIEVYKELLEQVYSINNLDEDIKDKILILLVLSTTSLREQMQCNPSKLKNDLTNWLENLIKKADWIPFQNTINRVFSALQGLPRESHPSFVDLTALIETCLIRSAANETNYTIDDDIKKALDKQSDNYYDTLSIYIKRQRAAQLGKIELSQEKMELHKIHSYLTLMNLQDSPLFKKIFKLFAYIKRDELDDTLTEKLIEQLQHLDKYEAPFFTLFFSINLERSNRLPKLDELNEFLSTLDAEMQKDSSDRPDLEKMQAIVSRDFPYLAFDNETIKVNPENVNILEPFKKFAREYPLESPEIASNISEEIKTAFNTLLQFLRDPKASDEAIIEKYIVLDEVITHQLSGFGVISALKLLVNPYLEKFTPKVKKEKIDDIEEILGHQFSPQSRKILSDWQGFADRIFENKGIFSAVAEFINVYFADQLSDLALRLSTNNKAFAEEMRKKLGNVDDKQLPMQAILDFRQRFAHAQQLLSTLVPLYNDKNQTNEYIEILQAVSHNLTKLKIGFAEHNKILEIIVSNKKINRPEVLRTVYAQLDSLPDLQRLPIALKELNYLLENAHCFSADTFSLILKHSFSHNLKKKKIFPIKLLIDLSKKKNQDTQFLSSILKIIKNNPELTSDQISGVFSSIDRLNSENKEIFAPFLQQILSAAAEEDQHINIETYNKLMMKMIPDNLEIIKAINHLSFKLDLTKLLALFEKLYKLTVNEDDLLWQAFENHIQFPPYLTEYDEVITLVDKLLNKKAETIKVLQSLDLDPRKKRVKQSYKNKLGKSCVKDVDTIIKEQFSTKRVKAVLNEIQDLLEHTNLSQDQQIDIAEQFAFINGIGYTLHPQGKDKPLTQFTRLELFQFSKELRAILAGEDPVAKARARLEFIALIREVLFRTTGKVLYSTQVISLLLTLNYPGNLMMQINTGNGKAISTAALAAMQAAEGKSTDVATANEDLSETEYHEYKPFFDFLSIESSVITKNSPADTYKVGGVNYSTMYNLSLYHSAAKLRHEKIDEKEIYLILDECDAGVLDNLTEFNYSTLTPNTHHYTHNPFAWIYPIINDFIDSKAFKTLEPGKVLTKDQDIVELKNVIMMAINDLPEPNKKNKQLDAISKDQFNRWINSACLAASKKEKIDFSIQTVSRGKEKVKFAVPKEGNNVQYGSTFSEGVQQFLHARLRKKGEVTPQDFPIDAELLTVNRETSKEFIDFYLKHGRIIGISGTLGTQTELEYLDSRLNMRAFSIPSHNPDKRQLHDLQLTKNAKKQMAAIKDAIATSRDPLVPTDQPVLIVNNNALSAAKHFKNISGWDYKDYQALLDIFNRLSVTGQSDISEDEKRLIQRAIKTIYENTTYVKNTLKNLLKTKCDTNSLEGRLFFARLSHNKAFLRLHQLLKNNNSELAIAVQASAIQKILKEDLNFESLSEEKLKLERETFLKLLSTGNYKHYQLVTGDESKAERANSIELAGLPNTITVTTSILGRGTDIKPEHQNGLFVIQTYFDKARTTRQILGRAARNGQEGRYVAILDLQQLSQSGIDLANKSDSEINAEIAKIHEGMSIEDAIARYYEHDVSSIISLGLKHFTRWQKLITEIKPDENLSLLVAKDTFLTEMQDAWDAILEEENSDDSSIVIDEKTGKYDLAKFDDCIKKFEKKVLTLWKDKLLTLQSNSTLTSIQNKDLNVTPFNIFYNESNLAELRYRYLADLSLEKDLVVRKYVVRQAKKVEQKSHQQSSHIDLALDANHAFLRFNTDIPLNLKAQHELVAVKNQFSILTDSCENWLKSANFLKLKTRVALQGNLQEIKNAASDIKAESGCFLKFLDTYAKAYPSDLIKIQPLALDIFRTLDISEETKAVKDNDLESKFTMAAIDQLMASLAWAGSEKKSPFRYIERKVVVQAAEVLYHAARNYRDNPTPDKLQILYKDLTAYQLKLQRVFIIAPFRIPNTLTVINKTIDNIKAMVNQVPKTANIKQASEDAFVEVYAKALDDALSKVSSFTDWKIILAEIAEIRKANPSMTQFYEIKQCLDRFLALNESQPDSIAKDLFKKRTQVISKCLQDIVENIRARNKDKSLFSERRLLDQKSSQFQERMKELFEKLKIAGEVNLTLSANHTGFSHHYELTIEAKTNDQFFTEFNFQPLNQNIPTIMWKNKKERVISSIASDKQKLDHYTQALNNDDSLFKLQEMLGSTLDVYKKTQFDLEDFKKKFGSNFSSTQEKSQIFLAEIEQQRQTIHDLTRDITNINVVDVQQKIAGLSKELSDLMQNKDEVVEKALKDREEKISAYQQAIKEQNFILQNRDSLIATRGEHQTTLSKTQADYDNLDHHILEKHAELSKAFSSAKEEVYTQLNTHIQSLASKIEASEKHAMFLDKKIEQSDKKKPYLIKSFKNLPELLAFESEVKKRIATNDRTIERKRSKSLVHDQKKVITGIKRRGSM